MCSALLEIHPIAGSIVYPQLADSLPYRLHVAGMAISEPIQPGGDGRSCTQITKLLAPFEEGFSLLQLDHKELV